jgi:hypothetical protein
VGTAVIPFTEDGDIHQGTNWCIVSERGWYLAGLDHVYLESTRDIHTASSLLSQRVVLPQQAKVPKAWQSSDMQAHLTCTLKGRVCPTVLAVAATAFGQGSRHEDHTALFDVWLKVAKTCIRHPRPLTPATFVSLSTTRQFLHHFFTVMFRGLVYSPDIVLDPSTNKQTATEEWCPVTHMPYQENAAFDCEDGAFTIVHLFQAFQAQTFGEGSELRVVQDLLKAFSPCFGICKIKENVRSTTLAWHAVCLLVRTAYLRGRSSVPDMVLLDATHALQPDLGLDDLARVREYERMKTYLDDNTRDWPTAWRLVAHVQMPAAKIREYGVYGQLFSVVWVDDAAEGIKQSILPNKTLFDFFGPGASPRAEEPITIASIPKADMLKQHRALCAVNPPPKIPRPPRTNLYDPPHLAPNTTRVITRGALDPSMHATLKNLDLGIVVITKYEVFDKCFVQFYDVEHPHA